MSADRRERLQALLAVHGRASDQQPTAQAIRDHPRVRPGNHTNGEPAYYDHPAEHWVHVRTTKPIESTFATVNAPHLVALVRAGAAFVNGMLVERPEEDAATPPVETAA